MIKAAGPLATSQGIHRVSSNRSMLGKCTNNPNINFATHLAIKEVVRHASSNNLVKLVHGLEVDAASVKSDVVSS